MSTSTRSHRIRSPQLPRRNRILVVDDHPLMREGIAAVIRDDAELEVCGEAATASEAIEATEKLDPDLVLCDITLAGRSGLEFVRDLKALRPDLPVVMLSIHDESVYGLRAIRAGARGYVTKRAGGPAVLTAIKEVLGGDIAFSPGMRKQLLDEVAGRSKGSQSPLTALTDREFEVLHLLGEGKTNREMGQLLNLSPKTVETHRVSIRNKLALKSTPELIRYAVLFAAVGDPAGSKRPAPGSRSHASSGQRARA
jgi:DNA-binding NarL/FixJ family response regulator